ncbi:MAG TPA: hypothetical protein VMM37_06655 [Bacteroidota bacterium]|nr:hypothetical protein [Bacteroidota bacterium]
MSERQAAKSWRRRNTTSLRTKSPSTLQPVLKDGRKKPPQFNGISWNTLFCVHVKACPVRESIGRQWQFKVCASTTQQRR